MTADELIEALFEAPEGAQVAIWDILSCAYAPLLFVEYDETKDTVYLS